MSHMKELEQKIIDLGEDIEKCFTAIKQPLIEGVDQAKRMCNKIINEFLNVSINLFFFF